MSANNTRQHSRRRRQQEQDIVNDSFVPSNEANDSNSRWMKYRFKSAGSQDEPSTVQPESVKSQWDFNSFYEIRCLCQRKSFCLLILFFYMYFLTILQHFSPTCCSK